MSENLRHLLDTLCSVSMDVDPSVPADSVEWNRLPAEAGLVLLEDENQRTILIRAIGHPRAFVRRRLDPQPTEDAPPSRLDYAAITRCVRVIPTGHTLLAELLAPVAEVALDPSAARTTAARLSGCVVRCDPTARLPAFTTVALSHLWSGEQRLSPHDELIGPFATPKHAQRWTETVIDLFDLCRYNNLLAQTPSATACVYKQMGKCPAPCDGTEPLESYRERFGRARRFHGRQLQAELDRCTHAMRSASEQLDFEQAASFKDRCEAITSLKSGGPWEPGDALATAWHLSGPTSKSGWIRRSSLSRHGLLVFADQTGTPQEPDATPPPAPPPAAVEGDMVWFLLDVLLDSLRKGLASGENMQQAELSPPPVR